MYLHKKFNLCKIFKPACAWFLEIAFVCNIGMCVCVCVCVCVYVCGCPQGYKLHSRFIEPIQPAEQIC